MPIPSLHLNNNEQVLLVLHRHWFVLARELVIIFLMAFLGITAFTLKHALYGFVKADVLEPLLLFLLSLYALLMLFMAFAIWINYRLDVFIITSRRLIDIEQRGLFNREVSEFLVENVQDVSIEIPNMIATFLDFGTMTIHTAGEQSFRMYEVPHTEKAKQFILEYSQKAQSTKHVGTFKVGAD